MKAIGIIRNVDTLGRIVIPKELRSTLNIYDGDPVEFFMDEEGHIVLRKYRLSSAVSECLSDLENLLNIYGGQLTLEVGSAMREHVSQMKKLIEKE